MIFASNFVNFASVPHVSSVLMLTVLTSFLRPTLLPLALELIRKGDTTTIPSSQCRLHGPESSISSKSVPPIPLLLRDAPY